MAAEGRTIRCERCRRPFRLAPSHRGPAARCPRCGFVFRAPPPASDAAAARGARGALLWRLRDDLVVQPVEEDGRAYVVIKDPVDQRFFRIGALEHYLVRQFDGKTDVETIRRRAAEERSVLVGADVLERFVEKFVALGLLVPADEPASSRARGRRESWLARILYLKVPLADPEPFLDALYRPLRWLFRPPTVVLMAATILVGVALAVANRDELLFGLGAMASLEGIVLVYLAVSAVTILHELAHGLTCRHFGGRVQDMGFLLMYFVPCFYTNVSDTYLFREKRQRLWVVFAGAYFELFLWALAVVGWRLVEPGTLASRLFFVVVGVSGVKTLFNFNPLIKLDGYYLLADALGIANLRREAVGAVGRLARRYLLGLDTRPSRPDLAGRRILLLRGDRFVALFGVVALAYTAFLVGSMLVWSGGLVFDRWGSTALGVFALAMIGVLHKPALTAAAGAREAGKEKWEQLGREKRRGRAIAFWTILFLAVALFPWQLRIRGDLRVLPQARATVRALAEGRIAKIHFREGDRVREGDLLVEYDTTELELELRTKQAERARAVEELRLMEKRNPTWQEEIRVQERALETARRREAAARRELERAQQLWTLGLLPSDELDHARTALEQAESERRRQEAQVELVRKSSPESRTEQIERMHLRDPEAQRAVIARLDAEIARLEALLERSRIRAPIAGILTTYRFEEKVGEFLEEGAFVCEIVDADRVVVEMAIPEKEIDAVREGYPVKFKVRGYPWRSFHASVAEIAPVATQTDKGATILLRATVDNPDGILKPGMTGIAKVYCGWTVVAHVLTRDLIRFLRTEFWL